MHRLWNFGFRCLATRRCLHIASALKFPSEIKMPALSPTMTDGSIVKWGKKEGEEFAAGDVLCEVQTDKAVVALEAEDDGTLAKIIVPANVPGIKIGDLIAIVANSGEDWKEVAASAPATVQPGAAKPAAQAAPAAAPSAPPPSGSPAPSGSPTSRPEFMGPAVRLLLEKHHLDISKIPASGPRGQLLKGDVLDYIGKMPAGTAEPAAPKETAEQPQPFVPSVVAAESQAPFTDIPLTNMRQVIAKRLSKSKMTIPHEYVTGEAWLDRLMELRRDLKAKGGLKLSVNDMLIKACALGLRMVPELNATCDEATNMVIIQPSVDICMAVATPAGLITPILFNADRTPITKLSERASALAKKARDGKLQPHEFQGGTFTISNLGMFKIREFTAIINQPQVAILAVGTSRPRAMFTRPLPNDEDEAVCFSTSMNFTLSIDTRFVEEAAAGYFLSRVSHLLGHPHMLLEDDPVAISVLNSTKADSFDSMLLDLNVRPPPPPPMPQKAKRG
ncbi:unnamed protein product [Calicophoron daubneyi]|uniref:Dihydrolipoamide acetyltransferase component of pyruvate dehydrogenase complex n=1 Tax=Calicophoron daubneyi TaxID=300641 RepID=A0AAV2TMV9_CALDB